MHLEPIIKNRQYNFPPIGQNIFIGAAARPNEITYSEEWMRPDYIPPQPLPPPPTAAAPVTGEPPPGRHEYASAGRGSPDGHKSGRRTDRTDGAAGSGTMMRAKWIRVAAVVLTLVAGYRLRLAGAELDPAAGR